VVHVLRKIKQKVGPAYSKKSNFKKEFNKLVTEETVVNHFERRWRQLIRKYNLTDQDIQAPCQVGKAILYGYFLRWDD
jgi:hypothetical protein